jgi:hypothetical protein
MPIPTIPPSLDFIPDDKTTSPKAFGTMLNKLWQRLFTVLFPIFTNSILYTPTITAGSGTFTTVSASGRYTVFGKFVFIQITIVITTNGTAAGFVAASLPLFSVNAAGIIYYLLGRGLVSAKTISGGIGSNSNSCGIVNYDGTYPGASGETLTVSGFYEIGG